ncbi:MAG: hypothetical protein P4M15_13510 [Alphaproteobacteria bacterium]|nr:hypothetical protein [Alphaproteobacteria bacterium]
MARRGSIDSLALQSARLAQSELAGLRHDLSKLRDSIGNLNRGAKAPLIATKRHTIKGSTSAAPAWVGIAGDIFSVLASGTGYSSLSQRAGAQLGELILGQRIR